MSQNERVSNPARSRAMMVIKTIEGRRSSAKAPISATDRRRQLDRLAKNGVRVPRRDAH